MARVCVDVNLPHLDRPFDYLVAEADAEAAKPGTRVRVRFAGQLVDGYLLERVASSTHTGRLSFLERVVSPEQVLHPSIATLAREIADRCAGTMADVLRLAVPPRHARVERERAAEPDRAEPDPVEPDPVEPDPHGWASYPTGAAFLRALTAGRPARAVWSARPGEDWPTRIAEAVAATAAGGRGAVVVLPDAPDLTRVDEALTMVLGRADLHVALSAAVGPAARYRRFLAVLRQRVHLVLGTRAAAFAPVEDLGLVVIWDDGDDLYAEPRSPYPHTRSVLLARAEQAGCAALLAGFTRSTEGQQLIETGWARPLVADRATLREYAPKVLATGDDAVLARDPAAASARLPSVAWQAARAALASGAPVLVQVPRRGYLPVVGCVRCHSPSRCPGCSGPLSLESSTGIPTCRWCARPAAGYTCPVCGARGLRAAVTGARRTAEELARAFPDTAVRTSGRDGILTRIPAGPALVVATPGAEPPADGGYGAVLLLDTWALLTRADLRATEETLRRWLAAASLAMPASRGGTVVVVAASGLAVVQSLIRFDPGWLAERELADRRELGFPPVARVASLTGTTTAIAELLEVARLPAESEVLGPVAICDDRARGQGPVAICDDRARGQGPVELSEERERMLVRVPLASGRAMAMALREAAAVRCARRATQPVRIQIDPRELL